MALHRILLQTVPWALMKLWMMWCPPINKDPRGKQKHKKQSHQDHRSGLGEYFEHSEGTSRDKRLKQSTLEIQPSIVSTLGNLVALTNQSFFNNNFQLDRLVQSKMILEDGHQVLNRGAVWPIGPTFEPSFLERR